MANPIVPPTLNVELDPQLQQEVNFFVNWGYLIVDNAATPEQIESLREALDASYERKRQKASSSGNCSKRTTGSHFCSTIHLSSKEWKRY